MKVKTGIILGLMMFLQYYVWGSWCVTMGTYMTARLGSPGIQIGAVYSALAIATMIPSFFVGMIADRFLTAQKVTGPNVGLLYTGIILHGICYDIFFVKGFIYAEKKSNERIKNAAQLPLLFSFDSYSS